MTALNPILIVAGAMLAVGLLTILTWLIHGWYLGLVEQRLATRKGLYRELVSDLATRDRALLYPTIHQISTLYDLDALEAVLEEQARSASGGPGWLLEVYDELGLVDKYVDMLRSARKWRDRAFAAELLGRVGGARAVPALLETVVSTRTEDSDVRSVSLRALARIADPRAIEPLIGALEAAEAWLAPRIADILARHGEPVIDPLIGVLNESTGRQARAWAANVLGEVRARRAFPSLVRLLDDPDEEVRAKAATALGRLDDRRAIGYLLDHLLTDPAPFVRARIATAMAQFGGPEVVDRLVRALGDQAWWVRMRSVEALEQIGAVAEAPLLVALDDADPEIRMRAAVALERLGVPNNLARMIENGERLPEASEILAKFATTGSREALAGLIEHHSSQVRSAVVAAVERAERGDLADELIQIAANDSEASVRAQALTALRSLGILEALPVAHAGLNDGDQNVRAASVALLGQLGGSDIVELLEAQTDDHDAAVRAAAIRALAGFGSAAAESPVRRLLEDPAPAVRESAVQAAIDSTLHSVVPSLVGLLGDGDPRVRRRAAVAIGTLGDSTTVPMLLLAFPDTSTDVSEAIAVAVNRLDPEAVTGLADALIDSPDVESKLALIGTLTRCRADTLPVLHRLRIDSSPAVRSAAVDGIARCMRQGEGEDDTSLEALESGLHDPDDLVRASATDAWVRICHERGDGTAAGDVTNLFLALLDGDTSSLVRERAALAIGLLQAPEGEEALIAICRRAEPAHVRAAAALALGVFQHQSIVSRVIEMPDQGAVREVLRERLKHDARFRLMGMRLSRARHLELRALASRSDAEAQTSLAQGLKSMIDSADRLRLIGSLRAFGGEQSRDALLQMVSEDPTPEVRTAALTAASDLLTPDELLSSGSRALGDPSVLVRRAAVALFTRVDPARALPRLIQAMRVDDDPAVLSAAAGLAEEQFSRFAEAAGALTGDGERAVLVIRIARHVLHPDLPRLLPPFARSGSPDVRAAVADLWKHRPDIADQASLETLTGDPDTSIRRTVAGAALASGRYDLLEAMRQDPDPSVRREIALVLGREETAQTGGAAILEGLDNDTDMSVRAAAYVAHLMRGTPLPLPPELDSQIAAQAVREGGDLPRLRQTARTSPSEEQRLAAGLALALLQDDVARDVARTDPAPSIRHRVSGALELSIVGAPASS
jgi:HEAT repeat protein